MTIELWKENELIRTFKHPKRLECKKVRNQWLKEIKNLTGIFYIIIKP